VAGGIAVPSMALTNYVAYRSAYRKLALYTWRGQVAPLPE
jgi:hypothetical protein